MEMPLIARLFLPLATAVFAFDERDEFLQKKIAVAHRAVGRIDIEGSAAFGSGNQELSDLVLPAKIVEQSPSAAVKEGSLVVAEAVQKIKYWIVCELVAGLRRSRSWREGRRNSGPLT